MSNKNSSDSKLEWPELSSPGRLQQIIDIIIEEGMVDPSKVTPDATLESMGMESMDVVMILMGVEEKLDIYLPMSNDLSSAKNMAEFVEAIDKVINAGEQENADEN